MAFYITWYILLWCDITMLYTLRTTCFFFFTFPVIFLTNKIEYKITIRFPHSAMIKVYCGNKTSSLSAIESWQLFFLIFWQYVHKHVSLHIVMIKVYFGKCVLTTLCFRHLSAIQNTMYVCMYVCIHDSTTPCVPNTHSSFKVYYFWHNFVCSLFFSNMQHIHKKYILLE